MCLSVQSKRFFCALAQRRVFKFTRAFRRTLCTVQTPVGPALLGILSYLHALFVTACTVTFAKLVSYENVAEGFCHHSDV